MLAYAVLALAKLKGWYGKIGILDIDSMLSRKRPSAIMYFLFAAKVCAMCDRWMSSWVWAKWCSKVLDGYWVSWFSKYLSVSFIQNEWSFSLTSALYWHRFIN